MHRNSLIMKSFLHQPCRSSSLSQSVNKVADFKDWAKFESHVLHHHITVQEQQSLAIYLLNRNEYGYSKHYLNRYLKNFTTCQKVAGKVDYICICSANRLKLKLMATYFMRYGIPTKQTDFECVTTLPTFLNRNQ